MVRAILIALVLGGLAIGCMLAFTSPPKLLSLADAIAGGGKGAQRAASGVAFGDHDQRLDIWAPAKASGASRPVVVFFHGGGWVKGDRDAYAFAGRAFAARGFVVVIPDYRKVPDVRFPAFIEDGAQAVAWTREHIAEYGGDPAQIALAGHSAGAHTAVTLALDPRWLAAEGLESRVVKAVIGLSGPYDFYPFDKRRSIDAMAQWPEPRDTQPIEWARADAAPMLLVTSSADTVVRPYNTENLAAKLREMGAPVEVENYAGLTHEDVMMAFSTIYRDKAPVLERSVAFLESAMGGGDVAR